MDKYSKGVLFSFWYSKNRIIIFKSVIFLILKMMFEGDERGEK